MPVDPRRETHNKNCSPLLFYWKKTEKPKDQSAIGQNLTGEINLSFSDFYLIHKDTPIKIKIMMNR